MNQPSEAAVRHICLALSGASGAIYFLRLRQRLAQRPDVRLHLVASEGGARVLQEENGLNWKQLPADEVVHNNRNIGALLASGSFRLHALVVIPCSMHSLAAVAHGLADNLIQRCASVQLKEGRRLILVPRETPLSLVNLRNMVAVREAGAVVLPAMPAFYHRPQNVEELVDTVVDRVLDQLDLPDSHIKRWQP